MRKLLNIFLLAIIVSFASQSCTDLDETVYSSIISDNFYQTEEQIISSMAPAYGLMRNLIGHQTMFVLDNWCTDEFLVPTRGAHWYDGGTYQRYHEHTWTPETNFLNQAWSSLYRVSNQANMLLYQFDQLDHMNPELKSAFSAELKILRAWSYWHLLDKFGNPPIVERFDVEPGFSPENNVDFTTGRKAVFEFIENDLVENFDKLSVAADLSTYGRFNKWAALALMTKLYINAEVWTGEAKWDEVIKYADKIINSGLYELEENYFSNFISHNEGSSENIFVIPFDEYHTGRSWSSGITAVMYNVTHHFSMLHAFGAPHRSNSGGAAIPSHVHSFDENDIRRRGWLVGPQYHRSTGEQLLCTAESAPLPLVLTIDFIDIQNPDSEVVFDHRNALEYMGARKMKYEIDFDNAMPNDFAVFRYADILLLKAEALMRKNGGSATQEAVELVNKVRSRAFSEENFQPYTTASLTLEALLQERSWELYIEGHRRNDLVRFDKFVGGEWEFFDRSGQSSTRNVYPIPQRQMNVNPNLTQNPGY